MGILTTKQRKNLPAADFVFPAKKAYPINDISHARNALARVSQFGSPEEKHKVRSKVQSKWGSLLKEKVKGLKNG